MKRLAAFAMIGVIAAVGLGGCGEREQTALYKDGKYRGKPDTQPWDNAPTGYGSSNWAKGDEKSWEDQVRSRSAAQNEYRRIGH